MGGSYSELKTGNLTNTKKNILPSRVYSLTKKKKWVSALSIFLVFFLLFWRSLPNPLFSTSYSTVLKDKEGILLGAKIAGDEQWRFPISQDIPEKFKAAIIEFEDRNFWRHPGVDPTAIARATIQNYKAGKIVSGASTLSMQVIRLSRQNTERSLLEKLKEMILALRLELSYSKDEILALYAAHAPFGGNVAGLEAASWRYFGRSPHQLSWAETATLAVLPNSPALIHPGRNRDALLQKRNRLLHRLHQTGALDSLSLQLALLEPLPDKPHALPAHAPHLLAMMFSGRQQGESLNSSLSFSLQNRVNEIVARNQAQLQQNGIHNMAVVVLDVKSKTIAAYVGNTHSPQNAHANQVDVAQAPRSTGSILKPFLYMLKLSEGDILPSTLIPDIPTQFSGYSPRNISRSYDGAVPANVALARSLNVPAVYMLQEFGLPKFHYYLNALGMQTVNKAPEHYGLTLILGGTEGRLLDITKAYGSLAVFLNNYDAADKHRNRFQNSDFSFWGDGIRAQNPAFELSAGAVWHTFEAMVEVNRPEGEHFWKRFKNSRKVAWKTGTSFGNRDGWAVGITPEFVVGVWVGNADGEGRPGLTGIKTAGPVLFDVFDALPPTSWFNEPVYDLQKAEICRLSGHLAGEFCEITDIISVPPKGMESRLCPYHKRVFTDRQEQWRVNSTCADMAEMQMHHYFVLPPVMEWYYRKTHPSYKTLPPLLPGCGQQELAAMSLIYPYKTAAIYVPAEIDGKTGKTVFEIAHRNSKTSVFWHLDGEFVGETTHIHQLPLAPEPGEHTLTAVDEHGERLEYTFRVIGRD